MKRIIRHLLTLFLVLAAVQIYAQDSLLNKYGLRVISRAASYLKSIEQSPGKRMVSLKTMLPNAGFDLKYSGKNNFMQQQLYPLTGNTYLRAVAADSLRSAQRELLALGINIMIWDAYRPYSITEIMWEEVKDDRYAANPAQGSGHNRGLAIDLTLTDNASGALLDMGTDFDNFSDSAHHDFAGLPKNVSENRALLKSIMEKHGFVSLPTEWWHYYLPQKENFELLDLSFDTLEKLQ